MTDDRSLRAIPRVADLIANADGLLITAGAGMSVDSGLPDYRGAKGLWGEYPPLAKADLSYEQLAQPHWFAENPKMAWAFSGHRQQLFRETRPHPGYRMLLEWGQAMPLRYFVVTSNVDGHFLFAGFSKDRLLEPHGNIHRYQCTTPCCSTIWHHRFKPEFRPDLNIDLMTLTARGRLPRCPACGAIARPNTMMFDDLTFVPEVKRIQQQRYETWLASARGKQLVILEIGAGTAIDTIRRMGERVTERSRTTLVRINPKATEADEPAIPIRSTALEALTLIHSALPTEFRERCLQSRPEEGEGPAIDESERLQFGRGRVVSDEIERLPDGRQRVVCGDLEYIKQSKMLYPAAWQITLACGATVWVERLNVERNYLDNHLDGWPFLAVHVTGVIESAKEFVRKNFYGLEPVVIPPKLYDATSRTPVLPPLLFVARLASHEAVDDKHTCSSMNLIWFAEIDDDKSIKTFVAEALAQVDWKKQATGYEPW
jgi:NAD-dependent SIR2 family protein deacetylase